MMKTKIWFKEWKKTGCFHKRNLAYKLFAGKKLNMIQ